ncbi:putative serine/threonine protein kinase [Phyllosticta citribraziliensis]|uniref:non-specific serine/threonine protein kinase n=1 Tax=Phyllosticta citribraziliensis TaxID=989973 RepID=A0ABR1L424_9PEZI
MPSVSSLLTRRTEPHKCDQASIAAGSSYAGRPPSPLRKPPTEGFQRYDSSWTVEEEMFPWYSGKSWYPVRVGDLFKERYQVIGKLFFGSVSTVWLCRDLIGHKYVTLKVYVQKHRQARQEPKMLAYLESVVSNHPGKKAIRLPCDTFEAERKDIRGQRHQCLIFEPLAMTLKELCEFSGGQVKPEVLKPVVRSILEALDFLHTEAGVVHTDIQGGNILFRPKDATVFEEFEKDQWEHPPGRKIDSLWLRWLKWLFSRGERVLFDSRDVPQDAENLDSPVLGDFGDAVMGGDTYAAHVMPDLYRAPEMIIGIRWDEKIDIWGLAMTIWDAIEGRCLFQDTTPGRFESNDEHLAMTIALLGPPEKEFAQMGASYEKYFDEEGNWKLDMKIPETSLEAEEQVLEGDERDQFLAFMRRILQWDSDDRPSAKELLDDPWLSTERASTSERAALEGEHRPDGGE